MITVIFIRKCYNRPWPIVSDQNGGKYVDKETPRCRRGRTHTDPGSQVTLYIAWHACCITFILWCLFIVQTGNQKFQASIDQWDDCLMSYKIICFNWLFKIIMKLTKCDSRHRATKSYKSNECFHVVGL